MGSSSRSTPSSSPSPSPRSSSSALSSFLQSLVLESSTAKINVKTCVLSMSESESISETETETEIDTGSIENKECPSLVIVLDRAVQPDRILLQEQKRNNRGRIIQRQQVSSQKSTQCRSVIRYHSQPIMTTVTTAVATRTRHPFDNVIDRWAAASPSPSSKLKSLSSRDTTPISPTRHRDSKSEHDQQLLPQHGSTPLCPQHDECRYDGTDTINKNVGDCRWVVARNRSDSVLLKIPQRFPEQVQQQIVIRSFQSSSSSSSSSHREASSRRTILDDAAYDTDATTAVTYEQMQRKIHCNSPRLSSSHPDESSLPLRLCRSGNLKASYIIHEKFLVMHDFTALLSSTANIITTSHRLLFHRQWISLFRRHPREQK